MNNFDEQHHSHAEVILANVEVKGIWVKIDIGLLKKHEAAQKQKEDNIKFNEILKILPQDIQNYIMQEVFKKTSFDPDDIIKKFPEVNMEIINTLSKIPSKPTYLLPNEKNMVELFKKVELISGTYGIPTTYLPLERKPWN